MIFVGNGFQCLKMIEDVSRCFTCSRLLKTCLNAKCCNMHVWMQQTCLLQKDIWLFSQDIRDATEKILIWVYLVSISLSKYFLHHQEGYCEVGSKRIIFLQIAIFWIKRGLENNYATTCWSRPLPYTDEKKNLEILILQVDYMVFRIKNHGTLWEIYHI